MAKELSTSEAKRLVQILLVEKKSDFKTEGFEDLLEAISNPKNLKTLLVNGRTF